MSGHSKWKTIQHRKGAADAKRGNIFSKLSREISIAARDGGADPEMNPSLRTLLVKAKSANMPADNIERAIKKGSGTLEGSRLEEVFYEGYGPGGVAIVVKALTDNRNRAAADIRHIFTKFGLNLANPGSVMRGFKRKGQIFVDASTVSEDKLLDTVLEAGAEDVRRDGDMFEVVTEPGDFLAVTDALENAGIAASASEITLLSDTEHPVTDKSDANAAVKFIDALEDSDEVQNVYSNMDLDDELLKELDAG